MKFKEPLKIYTAASNIETHQIVEMLENGGIAAYAEEDQSVTSLWAFGTVSQFHKPNVWVEKSTAQAAMELIHRFEEKKQDREKPTEGKSQIQVECEECGKETFFSGNLNGTTQECSHCYAFVDVGEFDWGDEDFGEPEE